MTTPSDSFAPATPSTPVPPPPEPVQFPLQRFLDYASAPLQYRALVDVAKLDGAGRFAALALSYRPALSLALLQGPDGLWFDSMLSVPAGRGDRFDGVGTIPAWCRLLEYGWDRESPPLVHARRVLFRLLAEDYDPNFLFELGRKPKLDPDLVYRGRTLLREAAAAALAQAGYEGDPRLRGAAGRILDRLDAFLRSPLAQKPWVRVANKQVLSPEAMPPSIYVISMIAHMPLFRSEHHAPVENLYSYLTQPHPRQELQQLIGKNLVPQPQLVLGDPFPNRNAAEADVPFALMWMELMARLQFLRRNDSWLSLYERFLDDRDRDFVWHAHRAPAVPRSAHPLVWSAFPLDGGGTDQWADVTFRLGLIARILGRPIELV